MGSNKRIYFEKAIQWLKNEKYPLLKNPFQNKKFQKDLERIKKGEPIDYVIGFSYFLNTKIDLSLKPFIPRPETEFLIEELLKKLKEKEYSLAKGKIKILDLCAGSGCIGIALLKNLKNVEVHFAEKEKKFIQQIKINLKINHLLRKKYKIIQSDLFQNIKEKYDFIFSNPPYVSLKKNPKIKEVIKWEPVSAIISKENGLYFLKRILKEVKNFLKDNGFLFLEFDSWQKKILEKLIKKENLNYRFLKDQFLKWRFLEIKNTLDKKVKK